MAKPNHKRTILREFQLPDIKLKTFQTETDITIEDEKVPRADVKKMISAGATRIGASASIQILKEAKQLTES